VEATKKAAALPPGVKSKQASRNSHERRAYLPSVVMRTRAEKVEAGGSLLPKKEFARIARPFLSKCAASFQESHLVETNIIGGNPPTPHAGSSAPKGHRAKPLFTNRAHAARKVTQVNRRTLAKFKKELRPGKGKEETKKFSSKTFNSSRRKVFRVAHSRNKIAKCR